MTAVQSTIAYFESKARDPFRAAANARDVHLQDQRTMRRRGYRKNEYVKLRHARVYPPDLILRARRLRREGGTIETVCRELRIGPQTFYRLMEGDL